jgi:hypothetical protein
MPRRKLPFLPTFFITLGVVFVIAVVVRLRAYTPTGARENTASSAAQRTPGDGSSAGGQQTPYEVVQEGPAAAGATAGTERQSSETLGRLLRRKNATPTLSIPPRTTTVPATPRPTSTPAVAPPKPAPPPRVVAAAAVIPSARQTSQTTPSAVRPVRNTDQAPSDTRGEVPREPKDKDPTSDTTPPQLLSVDFNPPQIRDGEETLLAIMATDDLSGVRVISGTIGTPTGGLQGFAAQREGESSRYVSRISVPKDAPEGLWRITYLNLSDNAGNTAMLSANQGTLASNGFRVTSSRSDTKPPMLRAVWLDRAQMRAGEKNIVFVQADDEGTGVNLVSGVFQSPSKFARIGFGCRAGEGPWQCDFVPPASADCGEWKLEQVQLQDKANNMATTRSDNPLIAAVRLTIGGSDCDSQPPEMRAIVLDNTVVSNIEKTTITVTATVSDDLSGVASMSGQVTGPPSTTGTPRLYFSLTQAGDPQTWTGQIQIPKLAAKGRWEIAWVQILDKANNLKTYSRSDAVLHNATFTVQ